MFVTVGIANTGVARSDRLGEVADGAQRHEVKTSLQGSDLLCHKYIFIQTSIKADTLSSRCIEAIRGIDNLKIGLVPA